MASGKREKLMAPRSLLVALASGIVLLAVVPEAAAQTPVLLQTVDEDAEFRMRPDLFDQLTEHYYSGQWGNLQSLTGEILDEILRLNPTTSERIDRDTHYCAVSFVATKGKWVPEDTLVRFLLPPRGVDLIPYGDTLPGVDREELCDLFLKKTTDTVKMTLVTSKKSADPRLAQIPTFVGKFPLAELAGARAMWTATFYADVSEIPLPHRRATVELTDTVTEGDKELSDGESTYANVPRDIWGFGLVVGAILGDGNGTQRVVEKDKLIAEDSLSGSVSMAVFNLIPFAGKPGTDMNVGQRVLDRLRFFVGGAFDPAPGIAFGGSAQLIRGLSLSGGYVGISVDKIKGNDKVGEAPSQDPAFERGLAWHWFFGFGYNF